jgi:cytochrome c553
MLSATLRAVLAFVLAGICSAVVAEDIVAGRAKAQVCAVCHGPLGVSVAPDTPNLAGHPATYLVAQLQHFRSGVRKHEVMNVMAKMLSDADIANLAAWYSAIKVEATAPP